MTVEADNKEIIKYLKSITIANTPNTDDIEIENELDKELKDEVEQQKKLIKDDSLEPTTVINRVDPPEADGTVISIGKTPESCVRGSTWASGVVYPFFSNIEKSSEQYTTESATMANVAIAEAPLERSENLDEYMDGIEPLEEAAQAKYKRTIKKTIKR